MELKDWQQNWNELGKDDPLWVVISDPAKKGGRWDPKEFFETGRQEIRDALAELEKLNIKINWGRALDFGCGVGRVTQALSHHFSEAHGVDISPSMVEHANQFNQFPGRCTYHVNAENGLPLFPANHFDFVYSGIVLQHIEPRFAKNYIREFFRVVKPDGTIVFQLLRPVFWRSLVPDFAITAFRRLKHGRKPYIGMFGIPENEMTALLDECGAKRLQVKSVFCDSSRYLSIRYTLSKHGSNSQG
jgi:SAM-dependent methyltransferase